VWGVVFCGWRRDLGFVDGPRGYLTGGSALFWSVAVCLQMVWRSLGLVGLAGISRFCWDHWGHLDLLGFGWSLWGQLTWLGVCCLTGQASSLLALVGDVGFLCAFVGIC
jgi:hypothetical protein